MFALVSIGEVMAEIRGSLDGNHQVGFAGDTYNTAVYCQRLLDTESSVAYITRVGIDPLSESWLKVASDEGIDVTHVSTDEDANLGIYSVKTDAHGERSFHYWRNESAARKLFSTRYATAVLPQARVTYLSGITLGVLDPDARRRLMGHLSAQSKAGHTLVAFDSNYRPRLWENAEVAREVMAEMWQIADIALPSIDDERALFLDASDEAVIDRFAQRNWRACAIKRGALGPVSPSLGVLDSASFLPAEKVVDTTAAGDSFNGGYLASLLSGHHELVCLKAGHDCATYVVGVRGAIAPRI